MTYQLDPASSPSDENLPVSQQPNTGKAEHPGFAVALPESFTLSDLIHSGDLQNIQDGFAKLSGVASLITDVNGNPVTRPSNPPLFCQHIRELESSTESCRRSAQRNGDQARQRLRPLHTVCPQCGLIEASAPIIIAGRHIANWLITQVDPASEAIGNFRSPAAALGRAPTPSSRSAGVARPTQAERLQHILDFLWLLSKEISKLGYNNLVLAQENQNLSHAKREIRRLNIHLKRRIRHSQRTNEELAQTLVTLRKTQETLIQREKLASLGNLVAGIAHEINTPIGVGVTAASLLSQETHTMLNRFDNGSLRRSDFSAYLAAVDEASQILSLNLHQAAQLIASFKQVAVAQSTEDCQSFNLKSYINIVLLSLRPSLKNKQHQVHLDCADDLMIRSYPGAFSQIITNLVMNALIHAFSPADQGRIHIRAEEDSEEAGHIRLTFSDNGRGIPPQHLTRIFEPFFTTHRGQGGTGLGLNILYNVVTQTLKGSITCTSTLGQGTTFIMLIPNEGGGKPDD